MPSIFLALPYSRPDSRAFTNSLMRLVVSSAYPIEEAAGGPYGMAIAEIRNFLTEKFLQSEATHILWIDNDCSFPAGASDRMIGHDVPMVCGGMYTIGIPPRPTIGMYMGIDKAGKAHYTFQEYADGIINYCYSRNIKRIPNNDIMFPDPELMEIHACGFHFVMIKREVVEAVRKPWFIFAGKTGAGEDFYFCDKARKAGFKIYTDLSIQTGHHAGEVMDFGLRELLQLNQMAVSGVVSEEDKLIIG